jgi:NADH:ubiquinone oxidoreductase subunit K
MLWTLRLLGNAIWLTMIMFIASWIFDESNLLMVASITCMAYECAVIGLVVAKLTRRISRIEMHALSVRNEVLMAKELIEDDSQQSVRWP